MLKKGSQLVLAVTKWLQAISLCSLVSFLLPLAANLTELEVLNESHGDDEWMWTNEGETCLRVLWMDCGVRLKKGMKWDEYRRWWKMEEDTKTTNRRLVDMKGLLVIWFRKWRIIRQKEGKAKEKYRWFWEIMMSRLGLLNSWKWES